MEEELSRSWRTLFQILKESSKDSYTPEEILSLMRRVLHNGGIRREVLDRRNCVSVAVIVDVKEWKANRKEKYGSKDQ